jgi:hypothetical protein
MTQARFAGRGQNLYALDAVVWEMVKDKVLGEEQQIQQTTPCLLYLLVVVVVVCQC